MSAKIYLYDYPEQREMAKSLQPGDYKEISNITGRSYYYVSSIFTGRRRIKSDIIEAYEIVLKANNAKRRVLNETPLTQPQQNVS